MKHEPYCREEKETAREGTQEPVKQKSQGRDPRTRNQKRAKPTADEQHAEKRVEVNDKIRETNLNVSAKEKSNVIINMNLKGKCFSPRQRFSEMKMRTISRRSRSYEMCEILVSCSMKN